jgi:hypothetical protein
VLVDLFQVGCYTYITPRPRRVTLTSRSALASL